MDAMTALVLAVPLVTFLSAAALPRGRAAALGIGGALVLGGAAWLVQGGTGDVAAGRRLLLALALAGLAMAGVAQGLRLLLPQAGPLSRAYPAILLAVLALGPALARLVLV